MTSSVSGSVVLVSDYRIPDPTRVAPLLERSRDRLVALGTHHVFVYSSISEPGRVLVVMALHTAEPITDLLRSRLLFEYFDDAGVEDLPAVFAGELVDRSEFRAHPMTAAPGVVVAGVTLVDEVTTLLEHVHRSGDLFRAAGVEKAWVFGAFDNPHEVMFLQEIFDEDSALRWLRRPDTAAEWLAEAGVGAYPPTFLGRLLHTMRLDSAEATGSG